MDQSWYYASGVSLGLIVSGQVPLENVAFIVRSSKAGIKDPVSLNIDRQAGTGNVLFQNKTISFKVKWEGDQAQEISGFVL